MIQVPLTQRAVSPGNPAAGLDPTQPIDDGFGGGALGDSEDVEGVAGEVAGLEAAGEDDVPGVAGVRFGLSNGGDHEPPRQVQPAPGWTPGQFPAPPVELVAPPATPLELAAVVAPLVVNATITQTPFSQTQVGLGDGVRQVISVATVVTLVDGNIVPPDGAVRGATPTGSCVTTVAGGCRFAPRISATSTVSATASATSRPRI